MASAAASDNYWARPIGFVVAADGSKGSQAATEAAIEHFKFEAKDTFDVIHVEDPTKDYLPYDMRRKAIEEYYSVHAATLFGDRFKFRSHIKEPAVPTRKAILDMLHKIERSEIFVVGYVGRKGPKEDPEVLGSVADLSLRDAHMSVFIVKRKPIVPNTVFVVGVDGSDTAHDAVTLAFRLGRAQDRVVLVHIEDPSAQPVLGSQNSSSGHRQYDADAVEARYTAFLAAQPAGGPTAAFKRVVKPAGTSSVADLFLETAQEEDAEIILVGVDGQAAAAQGKEPRVGSNTDRIVKKAHCNIIAVCRKNRTFNTNPGSASAAGGGK